MSASAGCKPESILSPFSFRRHVRPVRRAVMTAAQRCAPPVTELLENRRLLSTTIFQDDYSKDTSANYVQTDQAPGTQVDTWTVADGTLNYSRTDTNGWNTSVFLLKPQVASTAGLVQFATSGDLIAKADPSAGNNYQPGLVVSGDTTNGGFVVMEYDNGAFTNHLVLLQETGSQLVGDEGGTGNPPVLADLADLTNGNTDDTFHVVANVDRTGSHPVFKIDITDLTNPAFVIPSQTVTDNNVSASYGGTQIGWRARYDTAAAFSVDNLLLQNTIASTDHAPAAPTIGTATYAKGAVTLTFTDNADNEVGFDIQRSSDGTNFTSVGTAGAVTGTGGTGTFVDTTVRPNTNYTYKAVALNGFNGGSRAESGTTTVSTPADFPGFVLSAYSSDTANTYPFSGDSVAGQEQLSADGKNDEGAMSSGTAVLGYQEIYAHTVDLSGNDSVAPPDAPAGFNTIQGPNNAGHQFALRVSGIFTAPVTGFYTLGIASDDGGSASWANGDGTSPVTLAPVGIMPPPPDNITALRGNTLDVDPVVDAGGQPVQWIAGHQYQVQFDMNNSGGGWDMHAYYAVSSSADNQGSQTFDTKGQTLVSPGDVAPPIPKFKTVDFANPTGLAKDNPYYAGTAAAGSGVIELNFNNIAADSYNIYRATSAAGPYTKINAAPVPAHTGTITYDDSTVTNGTQYFYIVTGVDITGETSQADGLHLSATPNATPPAAPVVTSATPGAVAGINPLSFGITVNWKAVPLASGYNVLRGTTAGGEGTTPIATGVTGTSYTDPTGQPNTTYFYVVQAVSAGGTSANSNEVTVAVPKVGLPNVANAVTQHFYDNEWWGSNTQNTSGYQSPALVGHSVTSPYADTNGSMTLDLHGDDTAGDPLPPNGDIADNFSTIFTGKLQVAQAGSYTFNANTDDDGYMVIDGQIVATNPGGHGPQEGNATPITLTAGAHDFAFYQSNGGGGWDWHMEWNGPDTGGTQEIVPVGASATHGGIVSSTESTPKDPTAGSVSINGTTATIGWTDNSTSELEYVLQRSTDANFAAGKTTTIVLPFVENKGGAVATGSYTDSGLANGTYFYRLQAVNYDGQSAVLSLGSGTVGGGNFNKADFNHSGKVDFADLLILAQNYGKAATPSTGDTNGDGKVDFSDLLFLAQNYGKTGPQAGKTRGSMLSDVVGLVKTH